MGGQVDLAINVFGAQAVEFALGDADKQGYGLKVLMSLLWLGVGAAAYVWYENKQQLALYGAVGVALLAVALSSISGSAIVQESVLVTPSLGVQLAKRRRNGTTAVRFVDRSEIRAVVVNEAIVFNDVVYYIALMTEKDDNMVLVFEHFRPRVAILQQVFQHMQTTLFPEDAEKMRLPEFA
ncbi:hypothetical protein Poli38472_009665 [Pythium oligandrum]|uniref:Phosphatidylinositol N-acetylglucosaminyltransferase subunit H conserved domain-containing protein n=1 Tax=Pythium oligandrum TaxID=41045 RepID=A0A8K1CHD7_PYTOL|nr:hypothetical protein Poli38472_009665 [Pythium oligandrum]|eukprot:TMW62172.1 hypothetical protein Poli38472_009665 [Pythium oligandrum]